ncbi:hypothetical protein ACQPW3_20280 [Actinosynnema sp. CA-248983]
MFLGSVAADCVRHATCPIVVVPPDLLVDAPPPVVCRAVRDLDLSRVHHPVPDAAKWARRLPVVLFGGTKVRNRSEHLTHADVSAVFGGATLDLRGAHIDREADVDALALFGGVQVLVPEGWRVALGGLPVFGGYDDNTTQRADADAPLLRVNATAIGGVDVRNEPK